MNPPAPCSRKKVRARGRGHAAAQHSLPLLTQNCTTSLEPCMGLFSGQGAGNTSELTLLRRSQKGVVYMCGEERWERRERVGVVRGAALFSGSRWCRSWCRGAIRGYRPASFLRGCVNSLQQGSGDSGGEWSGMEGAKGGRLPSHEYHRDCFDICQGQ